MKTFTLKILRGDLNSSYFEEFELPLKPHMNIISALMEIQKNPVTKQGIKTTPVAWEMGCLEEVCGSCSMLINERPRQACTALIEPILEKTHSDTITLAPFSKFPKIKDLIVDRDILFERLKKAHAWIDTDPFESDKPGPKISQETQETLYALASCMACGCCLEACPQVNDNSPFIGPQILGQIRLFNLQPGGEHEKEIRIQQLMKKGGITGCGNAQNCEKACPKDVPLLKAIAVLNKDTNQQFFKNLFN